MTASRDQAHPGTTEGVTSARDDPPALSGKVTGKKGGGLPAISPSIHPHSPVSPESVATRQREGRVIELRLAGATAVDIAEAIGLADYHSVNRIIHRVLDRTVVEPADALRRLECDRLDRLQRAIWPKAMDASNRHQHLAIDRCIAIMERRARLMGLDAPLRIRQESIGEEDLERAIADMNAEANRLEAARLVLDDEADIHDAVIMDDPLDLPPQPDDPPLPVNLR